MHQIIESLKKLDLTSFPEDEVRESLNNMGSVAFMVTDYESPKTIERAVPNNEAEPVFDTVSRLSFKPSEYNNTFQRASTPSNTMFYGSVIPEDVSDKEIKNSRIIGASETCDLLRDKSITQGERSITFGKWEVQETLTLVTIVDPNKTYTIKFLNGLVENYNRNLNLHSPEVRQKTEDFLKFFTDEFAKPVNPEEHYNYMISALFTEIVTEMGYDGVLYPSVQTGGDGLCVAIHPRAMYKLKLVKVLQCRLVKEGKDILMTNHKYCEVESGSLKFQLQDIEEKYS